MKESEVSPVRDFEDLFYQTDNIFLEKLTKMFSAKK